MVGKSIQGYCLVLAILMMPASIAQAVEIPQLDGFCTEQASKAVKTAEKVAVYLRCTALENGTRSQLEKHRVLIPESDLKTCLRDKGATKRTPSYGSLMGCISKQVGFRCLSGELDCKRGQNP